MRNFRNQTNRILSTLNQRRKKSFSINHLAALFTLLLSGYANATVQNVFVSTDVNTPITINLARVISDITNPVVSIVSPPDEGTAATVDCTDNTQLCVLYTPPNDFEGVATFTYGVINDAGDLETEIANVKVGDAPIINAASVNLIEMNTTMDTICIQRQDSTFTDICAPFSEATQAENAEDLRVILNALTPQNVAAAGTISNDLAAQQLANIGKRLAALRSGQQLASTAGFAFNGSDSSLTGDMLAKLYDDLSTGGGAAADNHNSRWGWFINGTIGGGKQDESEKEDGFEFSTQGLSTGFDYRIGNKGAIGFAAGGASTAMDLDFDGGGLDARGGGGIIFGSFYPSQKSYVDFINSYSYYLLESRRRIVYSTFDEVAESDPNSSTFAFSVAGGHELVHAGGFTMTFDGKVEYIQTTIEAYSETNADNFNLTFNKQKFDRFSTLLGLDFTYAASFSWGVLIPQGDITWIHQFEENADDISFYYSNDVNQTTSVIEANAPDADYFKFDLGLSSVFAGGSVAYLQGSAIVSQEYYQSWYASVGYRLSF